METLGRFLTAPDRSFFLFGPRGTGKSTWLREGLPEAHLIDLLEADTLRTLAARPERLLDIVRSAPRGSTFVLDEVQRIPELLPVVHLLLEEKRGARFVMTGSSARKLRRGGMDLLGGRALLRTMHPFMAGELPSFSLDSALRYGMLPLVRAARDPEDVLRAYAALYLDQEVRMEGWVRNFGNFARFLEIISFSHGSVLNVANAARECAIERKTAVGYLEVIEDLLLSFTLPVFTRRAKREMVAHPKFYLFDAGVFRSIRRLGPMDRPSEIDGAALEGLVAQHLRAWLAYSESNTKLSYWRTRRGVEVDFVVYGEHGFWAIQVQNSTEVRPADLRPLVNFREDYPEATAVLLYRGKDSLRRNDVLYLPVEEFLRDMRPGQPLT